MNDSKNPDFKRFRKKSEPNKGQVVKARVVPAPKSDPDDTMVEILHSPIFWHRESFDDLYEPVLA